MSWDSVVGVVTTEELRFFSWQVQEKPSAPAVGFSQPSRKLVSG
jgi:hypothetical protein